MRASDVMTRSVVTVTQDATIVDAAKLMISHRISGVPVVEREGRLVGIVTEGDLLRRAETGTEGTAVHGAGGFRRTPDWLSITSSHTPDEWLTS